MRPVCPVLGVPGKMSGFLQENLLEEFSFRRRRRRPYFFTACYKPQLCPMWGGGGGTPGAAAATTAAVPVLRFGSRCHTVGNDGRVQQAVVRRGGWGGSKKIFSERDPKINTFYSEPKCQIRSDDSLTVAWCTSNHTPCPQSF